MDKRSYQNISFLIHKIQSIGLRYEKINKQDSFNVFSILRKPNDEVMLHSAFLAELLNPRGSHGFNDGTLLKLFVRQIEDLSPFKIDEKIHSGNSNVGLNLSCWSDDDFVNAMVFSEHRFNNNAGTDGRIDLIIESNNKIIIIENKIHAEDQYLQLKRYYDYALRKYDAKNIRICYLTLFGNNPDRHTTGGTDFPVSCVSYRENIQSWLDDCIKYAVLKPALRETIVQYKNLVKRLTGDTMNAQEEREIADLISKDKESINAVQNIQKSWVTAVTVGVTSFWEEVKNEVQSICLEIMNRELDIIPFRELNKESIKKSVLNHDYTKKYEYGGVMFRINDYKTHYSICLYIQGHAVDKNGDGERLTVDITILRKDENMKDYFRNKNNDIELGEIRDELTKRLKEQQMDVIHTFTSDYYIYRRYLKAIVSPANHWEEGFTDVLLPGKRKEIVKNIGDTVKDILDLIKPCLSSFRLMS